MKEFIMNMFKGPTKVKLGMPYSRVCSLLLKEADHELFVDGFNVCRWINPRTNTHIDLVFDREDYLVEIIGFCEDGYYIVD